MPDILAVTLDSDDLELVENVSINAFSNLSLPESGTNFIHLPVASDSQFDVPDDYSNFVFLMLQSEASADGRGPSELINMRIAVIPVMIFFSQRDNVSFVGDQVNADISSLDTQIALLVDLPIAAQLFEYSDLITKLIFPTKSRLALLSSASYSLFSSFGSYCGVNYIYGMSLSDTASFTASPNVVLSLAQVLRVLISGNSSINLRVSWDEYAQFIATCNSLFKSADLQQVGISVETILILEEIISTIVREYIVTSFSELSTLNAHELPNYVVNGAFDIISNVSLINSIELLVDTSLVITVPRGSSITATWYFMPKALSMHTMSPESVCEVDDILYMAFDDGIYVFDSSKEASNTGLVYDFGDLSIPAFKRLEELFISGEMLDELSIAVDMDDWRNEYSSEVSKIKFAKGHKGYRIKMFIEGLKRLDSLDLLLVFLTKRRR